MPVVSETPERRSRGRLVGFAFILVTLLLTAVVWLPLIHEITLGGRNAGLLGSWSSDAEYAKRLGPILAPLLTAPGLHFHRVRISKRSVRLIHLRIGRLRWLGGWDSS